MRPTTRGDRGSYTPGPWIWTSLPVDVLAENGELPIAAVQNVGPARGGSVTTEANARLMAAAPDLLAACRAALASLLYLRHDPTNTTDDLRAAIARAIGEERR